MSFFYSVEPISLADVLHPLHLFRRLDTQYCGRYVLQLAAVDSTNRALSHWEKTGLATGVGLPEGTTLIAAQQSAGRGQRGRAWNSVAGGLYCSILLYPNITPPQALELTLALAWGVARALRERLDLDVQLKWPNDLVAGDRKLGGLLLQTRSTGNRVSAVVAGLGLNVNNPTPEIGTSLAVLAGVPQDMTDVTAIALHGIERGYERWQATGFARLRAEYEALMRHHQATVRLDDETGTVAGLTSAGALCVLTERGKRCFYPGELSLGYAPKKKAIN
ncbi:MAG: biotin--[acetyl-CoA-carboxylase] ligase [Cyanobacteria bacterium P01_D01_bin.123]